MKIDSKQIKDDLTNLVAFVILALVLFIILELLDISNLLPNIFDLAVSIIILAGFLIAFLFRLKNRYTLDMDKENGDNK